MILNYGEIGFGVWAKANNPITTLRVIGKDPRYFRSIGDFFFRMPASIVYFPFLITTDYCERPNLSRTIQNQGLGD